MNGEMKKALMTVLAIGLALCGTAQSRSVKRGVCWDEKTQPLSREAADKLASGVSWVYNWGPTPRDVGSAAVGPGQRVAFVPMCWNGSFDEASLRAYLTAHPGVKYLLGFNEPNISWASGGSSMTPQQAADAWPRIEKIADDFGLRLVAPALNFSGDKVGGQVYATPYDWLEAFLALRPTARMDCLCLHSYMDYAGAVGWFATEYFYKDIFSATNRAKYPRLAAYIESRGELPLFLTEFCAMGNDFRSNGLAITPELQIDQMTQKVQLLERSPRVEGYAWFMANGNASASPYWSLMETNTSGSRLSELGTVYVHLSAFDTTYYHRPGAAIMAKDYVDASMGDQQVRLRSNTDMGRTDVPLQVEFGPGAWATYQMELPSAGVYSLAVRAKSAAPVSLWVYVDGRKSLAAPVPATEGAWTDVAWEVSLPAGRHRVMLFNAAQASLWMNGLTLGTTVGVGSAVAATAAQTTRYSLDGMRLGGPARGIGIERRVGTGGQVSVRKTIQPN